MGREVVAEKEYSCRVDFVWKIAGERPEKTDRQIARQTERQEVWK